MPQQYASGEGAPKSADRTELLVRPDPFDPQVGSGPRDTCVPRWANASAQFPGRGCAWKRSRDVRTRGLESAAFASQRACEQGQRSRSRWNAAVYEHRLRDLGRDVALAELQVDVLALTNL
jgi:hypothetical protein